MTPELDTPAGAQAAEGLDVLDSGRAGGMAIRGGVIRTAGHFAALTLSLASAPFMIRHLGEADYGRYMTVSAILFIIGGATEAGLTQLGIKRYAALGADDRPHFLRVLVGLRLALTVVGVGFACAFSAVTGQPGVVVAGTAIMGLGLLLSLTQQTYAVSLSAQLRLGWVAGLDFIANFSLATATIFLVVVGASLVPFFWAAVFSGGTLLTVTLLVLRQDAALLPRFDLQQWRSIMREVLPFALAAAVGLIYFRLAIVIMSYISTERETGLYSAAQRIVEAVAALPWLVTSAGFPILARAATNDEARLRGALQRLFEVTLLLGGGAAIMGVAGAKFAVAVVAGADFQDATPVLQILVCSLLMTFLVATWSSALLSISEYRRILWANLGALVTTGALSFALIPSLDAQGAAIATVAAETALALGYLFALGHHDRRLVPSFGVVGRLLPGAALAAAFGLLAPLPSVVESAACGAIYLGGAFLLGAVPPELLHALLRRDVGSATTD
jgi:O-antigen/teichoic acid export membrane protein